MPVGEVVAVVTGVVGCAVSVATVLQKPVARFCSYVKGRFILSCSYVKDLEQKCEDLENKEKDLKELREEVRRYLQMDLHMWITSTHDFMDTWAYRHRKREYANSRRRGRCMIGLLPNYCYRYQVGKQIAGDIIAIDKLLEEGRALTQVDRSVIRRDVRETRELVGLEAYKAVEEMFNLMASEDIKIIGVCGMGGAGKTEAVAVLRNRTLESHMINHVIWVEVTHESNLQMLQMQIARSIHLRLPSDSSVVDNAAMLMAALVNKDRVVYIFDDMWRAFSLEDIGIPKSSLGSWSKVVITSRFSSVCSDMQADRQIELNLLPEDEAYNLLLQEVGPKVSNLSEPTRAIMKSVAAECGGLPSAIIAVARYLRKLNDNNNDDDELRKALTRKLAMLRESSTSLQVTEEWTFTRLMPSFETQSSQQHPVVLSLLRIVPEKSPY